MPCEITKEALHIKKPDLGRTSGTVDRGIEIVIPTSKMELKGMARNRDERDNINYKTQNNIRMLIPGLARL